MSDITRNSFNDWSRLNRPSTRFPANAYGRFTFADNVVTLAIVNGSTRS